MSQRLSASLSNAASRLSSSFVSSFISTRTTSRRFVSTATRFFFGDVTPLFFPSPSLNPTTRCLTNRLKFSLPLSLAPFSSSTRLSRLAAGVSSVRVAASPNVAARAPPRRRRVISPSSVTIVLAPSSFGSVSLSSLSSLSSASVSLPSSSSRLWHVTVVGPLPSVTVSVAPSSPSSTSVHSVPISTAPARVPCVDPRSRQYNFPSREALNATCRLDTVASPSPARNAQSLPLPTTIS